MSLRGQSIFARACCAAFFLGLSAAAPTFGAPVTGLSFSTNPWSFPNGNYNYGWTFTTSAPLNISALGVWDKDGNGLGDSHQVGIWNSSGVLQTSTTVSSGSGAAFVASGSGGSGFRFITLGSPVTLPAGSYTVAAQFPTGADEVAGGVTAGNLTMAPFVTYGESRQGGGSFAMPGARIPGDEIAFFGGNFQYSALPEPSTFVLGALGVGGLCALGRRKFRRS